MDALTGLLRAMSADGPDDDDATPRPIPEAVVSELRDIYTRYSAGCPFKPGDLVTPRKGYNTKGAGEPHIVLEVIDSPACNLTPPAEPFHAGSHAFGRRYDMRVISLSDGEAYVAHWTEAWVYEPYTGPTDIGGNA